MAGKGPKKRTTNGTPGTSRAEGAGDSQAGSSSPQVRTTERSRPRRTWIARRLPAGIRARLFLLIALALLPVLTLQGWIYYHQYVTRRSQALQMEREVAEGVATTFSAYAEGVHQQLNAIGQAILAFSPYEEAQTQRILTVIAAQYTTIRNMHWISPAGVVLASSEPGAVGRDLSHQSFVQELGAGRPWSLGDLAAQGIVVDAPSFVIAAGVQDENGRLQGIAAASIDPLRLGELALTQERPAGGEYAIFDRQGRLVYQNPEIPLAWEERLKVWQAEALLQRAIRGQPAVGEMMSSVEGDRHLAAYVPIADTGWFAGAARPLESVLAPVWRGLLTDTTLAVLAMSLAFVFAYLIARTIGGPLLRLERDARAMGEARLEPIADPEAPQEVRSLRGTITRMAGDLLRRAEALRESEQRFQTVLENSLDAAYRRNLRTDRYEYLSPVLQRIVGFSPQEMRELSTDEVLAYVHPEDVPRVRRELGAAEEAGRGAIEYRFRCKDGTYRWLADYFVVQKDPEGRPRYYNGSIRDITGLKQAEQALHELTRTLETKVAARTAELEQRARQLQKLALELSQTEDRERQHLAEILHDDLQQQLAAAKFHLGLLGHQLQGDASLHETTVQVQQMIKGAIEMSRSLSHELSPALLYHGDFGEALEWLARQIQAKHGLLVHVQTGGPIEVASDPVKTFLFRAAQEILFNVVKHAGVPEAALRLWRRHGQLRLAICDRGRGFDPKTLGRAAGFGLLSIRERVELLGGRMKIRSAPGRGSVFLIAVPEEQAAQDPVSADLARVESQTGHD